MIEKKAFLTEDGFRRIKRDLDSLKSIGRKKIATEIQAALCCADIEENAEYDRIKNEQAQLEERIIKLETIISNAILIDENEISTNTVSIGSKVLIKDLEYEEEIEYTIVGSFEANPFKGKISNESPLGRGLLGSKEGDKLEITVDDVITKYEIIEIDK